MNFRHGISDPVEGEDYVFNEGWRNNREEGVTVRVRTGESDSDDSELDSDGSGDSEESESDSGCVII